MNKEEIVRMAKVEQRLDDVGKKLDDHIIEQRKDFNNVFKKLDKLSEVLSPINEKIKINRKLIYGAYAFAFAILTILINLILSKGG